MILVLNSQATQVFSPKFNQSSGTACPRGFSGPWGDPGYFKEICILKVVFRHEITSRPFRPKSYVKFSVNFRFLR